MTPITPTDNLHTVYMYGGSLCLRCKSCEHRAVLRFENAQGNMKQISRLRLVCSMCGGGEVEALLPANAAEAERFLEDAE